MADDDKRTNLTNSGRRHKLLRLVERSLAETLEKGYYGRVVIEYVVEDGILQGAEYHRVEKDKLTGT